MLRSPGCELVGWKSGGEPTHSTRLIVRGDAEIVKEERVNVGREFEGFGGAAGAVAGFGVDANEDGIVVAGEGLQRGGVFEGVRRNNAVVVVGGGDERGGI